MRGIALAWMLGAWLAAVRAEADNRPPRISGSPPGTATVNEAYDFRPSASDPDRDALSYSIFHKPGWASFNRSSGQLSGTPRAGDVGTHPDIRISVSDGRATAALPEFRIVVSESGNGAVTLSWDPPTNNEDGSPLQDLAGYRIYLGRSPSDLSRVILVNNPGVTRFVVEGLSRATWHFAMTSVNRRGRESRRSAVVRKAVG